MFFVISKLLLFLIVPFNWVVLLLLVAVFYRKRPRLKRRALRLAVALVVLLTNPLILKMALRSLEASEVKISQLHAPYQVGIVLGGYTHMISSAPSQPVFNPHGNRLFQAIRLYRMGIIQKILLTGGSGSLVNTEAPEASAAQKYLLDIGIPADDILIDSLSRTTYENAIYTKTLLARSEVSARCLLITSAFHMLRSSATFKKTAIAHDIFPTDFLSVKWKLTPNNTFMPDEMGFYKWQLIIKEWFGYITYKFKGQI